MTNKLKKIWELIMGEKPTRITHIDDSIFYKQICVSKYQNHIEAYDTTTDIYRPLTGKEIDEILRVGAKNFAKSLKVKALVDRYHYERASYHREAIKGNIKKRDYHFYKAKEIIKELREI